MTPYGIIYTDGAYTFEQSVAIWQKKFGVMKISQLVKTTLIINIILAFIYAVSAVILKDKSYLLYYIMQFFASAAIVYSVMRVTNVKNMAAQCRQKSDIQIVFYDEKLVVTMPYSKSEYYYDELCCCIEKNGVLTVVVDESVAPLSISNISIKKGNYAAVRDILCNRLTTRFVSSEVNV